MPPITLPYHRSVEEILVELQTSKRGLSLTEAAQRFQKDGGNIVRRDPKKSWWRLLLSQFESPLILILVGASLIAFALGDRTEAMIVLAIVLASSLLSFVQEFRSEHAMQALRKQLSRRANVVRQGKTFQINAEELVVGDIVELERGNIVPADVRLIEVHDIAFNESALTGESLPVSKHIDIIQRSALEPSAQSNMAFLGTHVVQGAGYGVVCAIGSSTQMGKTAELLTEAVNPTAFQRGVENFGSFLLKITIVLCVVVAVLLGILHGNWGEALLFALALAVGISPELLPLIVTLSLSRGALKMSQKLVLVKRLASIENLGSADVFCTDKTGTLTVGKLRYRSAIDVNGRPSLLPLLLAKQCLELDHKGRATNPVDEALFDAAVDAPTTHAPTLLETLPFDYTRRRMSCIYKDLHGVTTLVSKGATHEILSQCTRTATSDGSAELTTSVRQKLIAMADQYHDQGYRLLAVARKTIEEKKTYDVTDEAYLEFMGFVLVSDAPKETARAALQSLKDLTVRVVILTGDHEKVTAYVAKQLNFPLMGIKVGEDVDAMSEDELQSAVEKNNVFARITPAHKLRILKALQAKGHTVGFMGDGINDAPALRAADVGISFDEAVDVAKEAASIILQQKKLSVLADGIREGRRTFLNTQTYIHATISSNFGNMLSVTGAALLLPFIPMLPAQILLLNLLSDIPMLLLPGDHVDPEALSTPTTWDLHHLSQFMYFFGTISTLADFTAFGVILFVFNAPAAIFRSAWFFISMLTEMLVIYLFRTPKFSWTRLPKLPITIACLTTAGITVLLLQTPLGATFELQALDGKMYGALLLIVVGYAALNEIGKRFFLTSICSTRHPGRL